MNLERSLSEYMQAAPKYTAESPPLRLLTIPKGTLLGFKACPGRDATRLLTHCAEKKHTALWSAIYVQLSLQQAINYVPNQYDRGEEVCCICRMTTRQPLQIAVFEDVRMGDNEMSSEDKAQLVRDAVLQTPELDWKLNANDTKGPLLNIFGARGFALCLLDCETYEVAMPHNLVHTDWLTTECLIILPASTTIPGGVIGSIIVFPRSPNDNQKEGEAKEALRIAFQKLPTLRPWDLADPVCLGQTLEDRLGNDLSLDVRSTWFSNT